MYIKLWWLWWYYARVWVWVELMISSTQKMGILYDTQQIKLLILPRILLTLQTQQCILQPYVTVHDSNMALSFNIYDVLVVEVNF